MDKNHNKISSNAQCAARLAFQYANSDFEEKYLRNHLETALDYADADRSDPFARDRVISHTLNGVASHNPPIPDSEKGGDGFYRATIGAETRTLESALAKNGEPEDYTIPTYTNLQRP